MYMYIYSRASDSGSSEKETLQWTLLKVPNITFPYTFHMLNLKQEDKISTRDSSYAVPKLFLIQSFYTVLMEIYTTTQSNW